MDDKYLRAWPWIVAAGALYGASQLIGAGWWLGAGVLLVAAAFWIARLNRSRA